MLQTFGLVLSCQWDAVNQKFHPCAIFSRRLFPAEVNYDVGNQELLAVVLALQEWRHWLEGPALPFVVWTDHKKKLEYVCSAKRLNFRQTQWVSYSVASISHSPTVQGPNSRLTSQTRTPAQFSCIVGAAKWHVKEKVREAQSSVSSPAEMPPNRLFIPESVRLEVPPTSGDRFVVLSGLQRAFRRAIIHSPTGNLRGANQSLESARWTACNWLPGARFCLKWNMCITRFSAEVTHLRVIIWKL